MQKRRFFCLSFRCAKLLTKRYLGVELSATLRGGAGPTPSRSPSYPRNALWGAWARAGESANARELMGAARGASWKRRKSLGRAWGPCGLVSTPRRARGLSRGACRCVETGLALNPELMLGTSKLSKLATTHPHGEIRRHPLTLKKQVWVER